MSYEEKLFYDDDFFEAEKIRLAKKISKEKGVEFIYALDYAKDELLILIQ